MGGGGGKQSPELGPNHEVERGGQGGDAMLIDPCGVLVVTWVRGGIVIFWLGEPRQEMYEYGSCFELGWC